MSETGTRNKPNFNSIRFLIVNTQTGSWDFYCLFSSSPSAVVFLRAAGLIVLCGNSKGTSSTVLFCLKIKLITVVVNVALVSQSPRITPKRPGTEISSPEVFFLSNLRPSSQTLRTGFEVRDERVKSL